MRDETGRRRNERRNDSPNEKRGPVPLAQALRGFLDKQGFADRVEQASVLDAWPTLVGPAVAAATKPLAVTADGTLFVGVRTSAWMSELAMMEREILAAVNRALGRAPITRIRWQLTR
jgi:predicted nucleic acid-binding Zn ribbon protein